MPKTKTRTKTPKDKLYLLVNFGSRLRALRLEQGYSQEDFAHKVGLHRTYMGAVERGEQNVSLINLARIAEALNMPIGRLLDEVETNSAENKNSLQVKK